MRTLYLFLFVCFSIGLFSQSIYKSGDPGSDWSSSNLSHIKSDGSTPSSGYSESNSSSGASGGNNAIFNDCIPPLTTYTLTSPAISTVGKSNIRIGFGQRHTTTFTSAVLLEWSSNGSSWNNISSNVVSGGTGTWSVSLFDLASSADNLLSLQFRFSFTTSSAAINNCPVGGNFKIDDFWVGSNFKLPIQLSSFSVTQMQYPVLQWTTLSESNNDHFVIERSRDGTNFTEIDKISGHPLRDKRTDYSYTDFSPYRGLNYYRLKQVDLDGFSTLFSVRSVFVPIKEIIVYPTLFHNKLNIDLPESLSKNYLWNIADLQGRTIQSGEILTMNSYISIDLNIQSSGPYIFQLKSDIQVSSFKIIKN
jgi:hypothetical protein